MNGEAIYETNSKSSDATAALGAAVGAKLTGGETIELVGDLGSGKTVFVRGLAKGIKSKDQVQSPSFTISRVYRGTVQHTQASAVRELAIYHFDFHRLEEPGLLVETLDETVEDPEAVVVVEWSDIVKDVLPKELLQVKFETTGENSRQLTFIARGKKHTNLLNGLRKTHNKVAPRKQEEEG